MESKRRRIFISLMVLCLAFLAAYQWVEGAGTKKTIHFWIYGGAEIRDPIKKLTDDFEKVFPDVVVDVQVFAGWPDLNRKALLALAGGDPPDVIRGKPQLLADFAEKGALMPLDDFIKKENVDTSDFVNVLFEKSARYGGKTYAFPFHVGVRSLWYNPDLFKAAGIGKPPDTWDDVVEIGKKLTNPQKKQWGFYPILDQFEYIHYLWQNGGQYLNADNTKVEFNSPEGVEALKWLIDCIYKHKISPPMGARSPQDIYQNRVGMWNAPSENRAIYRRDYPALKFETALNPKKVKRTSMEMSSGLMIFSASKVKKEAWELIKFLCLREDSQRYMMTQSSFLPVHKKVLTSPPFSTDPFYKPFIWYLFNDIDARPIIPGADEMMNVLNQELQEAFFQKKTPEKALADAEAKLTEILSRNR